MGCTTCSTRCSGKAGRTAASVWPWAALTGTIRTMPSRRPSSACGLAANSAFRSTPYCRATPKSVSLRWTVCRSTPSLLSSGAFFMALRSTASWGMSSSSSMLRPSAAPGLARSSSSTPTALARAMAYRVCPCWTLCTMNRRPSTVRTSWALNTDMHIAVRRSATVRSKIGIVIPIRSWPGAWS